MANETNEAEPKRRAPRVLTKEVREAFLTQLAATAHVGLAAAAVEIKSSTLYKRRRTDARFAHEWRMALPAGYDRIEGALIRRALGQAHAPALDADYAEPVAGELDVSLALQLLGQHRGKVERATKEGKEPFRATRDAAEETLLRKIRAYAKSAGIAPPFAEALPAPAPADVDADVGGDAGDDGDVDVDSGANAAAGDDSAAAGA